MIICEIFQVGSCFNLLRFSNWFIKKLFEWLQLTLVGRNGHIFSSQNAQDFSSFGHHNKPHTDICKFSGALLAQWWPALTHNNRPWFRFSRPSTRVAIAYARNGKYPKRDCFAQDAIYISDIVITPHALTLTNGPCDLAHKNSVVICAFLIMHTRAS